MGVVRREGDWRLEKRKGGVYEVTYKRQSEAKVITEDYNPDGFRDERDDFSIPVHEVQSFSEAEDVFTRMVEDEPRIGGFGSVFGGGGGGSESSEADNDLSDLPPGGFIIIGVAGGGYFISRTGFDIQSPLFLLGVGMVGVGLMLILFTVRIFSSDGPMAAADYLISGGDDESKETEDTSSNDETTTPPAPEDLKNELYFERASKKCEWCDEAVDSPDVHHITPRNEGGPNEPENLIVLCPNCHRKADRGVISRSKLRYQVSS